jgi:hypothetical protein
MPDPKDVFVSDATTLIKTHHHDMRQHYLAAGRRHAWKIDAHFSIVSETNNQLVHYLVLPDGA